ncbi:mediator of RNA polymerase II transcription subunit 1-like [Salminus brasiliensis]|uniref:mediator of RNA polymerase II transcription subunit 1-like n=1 Tax=Salminus brasiliensis TaxID=930266 RepID=UPI003B82E7B2
MARNTLSWSSMGVVKHTTRHLICMETKTYMSDLYSKYAEKPWSETFQLVRRCMDKTRADPKPCEPVMRCQKKLNEALNVASVNAMVTRLEMIAQQRGLGSHRSPTETACYLTADLFYLEVLLLPGGGVEDVKVAQHGEAPESNASLCQLLRNKKFEEFSLKLEDLACLYNIPGDSDTKIKVYTSLQHLQKDLLKISNLPRRLIENDVHVDMVLNGRIGNFMPCKEGNPMSIQYYISPSDILMEMFCPGEGSRGQVAMVVVGASGTTHRLQMESLIPTPPQVDSLGLPVFRPLSEVSAEPLPAFFLLKLQPPLPVLNSFIQKMNQITDVTPEADLQGEPLFQLIKKASLAEKTWKSSCDEDIHCYVTLPDAELHSYVFCGAEWECDSWKGAQIHAVPFIHPAHVPALLEILRHQSVINVLLASCIASPEHQPGLAYDLNCEVLPESGCSFSVTFSLLDSDSLAVLLVSVVDCRQVQCRLLMAGLVDPSLDDYISRVLTRCMSIPITMRAVRKRIATLRPPAPLFPEPACVLKAESSPSPMEEDGLPSPPGHYVMSVAAAPAVDGANTDAVANPSPCASVSVYSHWGASSLPAELI